MHPEIRAAELLFEADGEAVLHEESVVEGCEGGEVEVAGRGERVDGEGDVGDWHFELFSLGLSICVVVFVEGIEKGEKEAGMSLTRKNASGVRTQKAIRPPRAIR
jgi:hypothetical protein